MTSVTVVHRFWSKVIVRGDDECWDWIGAKTKGYGRFNPDPRRNGGTKQMPAHRWAYQQLVGPIPEGLTIDHLCRNRSCVNPAHMEPVTNKVNTLRGESVSAQAARRTHCPRNHPYNEENTRWVRTPYGRGRKCITCERERDRRRRRRVEGKA